MWILKRSQCSTLFTCHASEMESLLDNGGYSGVLLMDLSKAFDCLVHDLLTAELTAYGFDHNVTQLIHSYLTNRWQRVRIKLYIVHGSLVFNVYLAYACKEDIHSVIKQLEKDSRILLEWVTNPDKFHLLLSSVYTNLSIIADQHEISNRKTVRHYN